MEKIHPHQMHKLRHPLISVIIPTHFRAQLLWRALQSINTQCNRSLIEIVVISDAADTPTDRVCQELLNEQDIYVRRNGKPGPSASRNVGLTLARGKFIMFLDDDDAWDPDFIEKITSKAEYPLGSLFRFDCTVIKESRPPEGPIHLGAIAIDLKNSLTDEVFVKNQVHMSCYMFSERILRGIQFDEHMRAYEDWDFILTVLERERPVHIPAKCSIIYEVDDHTTDRRGSSADATNLNAVLDYLYVYRRHPSLNDHIRMLRQKLLASAGLVLPRELL